MLEVILYGYDREGRLTLRECQFATIKHLALYFCSAKGACWEWAEVDLSAESGQARMVHYSASQLRGRIISSGREPSLN